MQGAAVPAARRWLRRLCRNDGSHDRGQLAALLKLYRLCLLTAGRGFACSQPAEAVPAHSRQRPCLSTAAACRRCGEQCVRCVRCSSWPGLQFAATGESAWAEGRPCRQASRSRADAFLSPLSSRCPPAARCQMVYAGSGGGAQAGILCLTAMMGMCDGCVQGGLLSLASRLPPRYVQVRKQTLTGTGQYSTTARRDFITAALALVPACPAPTCTSGKRQQGGFCQKKRASSYHATAAADRRLLQRVWPGPG